jgi:hypothetical protein
VVEEAASAFSFVNVLCTICTVTHEDAIDTSIILAVPTFKGTGARIVVLGPLDGERAMVTNRSVPVVLAVELDLVLVE